MILASIRQVSDAETDPWMLETSIHRPAATAAEANSIATKSRPLPSRTVAKNRSSCEPM